MKVARNGKNSVKKTMVILVFGVFILAFAGIMLFNFIRMATKTFRDEIKIELGGEFTETYSVEALDLTPGRYRECKLVFDSTVEGDFIISLWFTEKEVGELRKYINVQMFYVDETPLVDETLETLFDEKTVTEIPVSTRIGETLEITVRYLMPEKTGNEAQGAFSKFDLVLSTAFAK